MVNLKLWINVTMNVTMSPKLCHHGIIGSKGQLHSP